MTRFCPSCNTDVEERDGHCLLGHPLRLEAPTASLTELRAEVEKAFEAAEAQVAAVTGEIPVVVASSQRVPFQQLAPPPPPPPPPASQTRFERVWAEMEAKEPAKSSDPITAFAPPPRMDWGPNKGRKRVKVPFGRSRTTKLA